MSFLSNRVHNHKNKRPFSTLIFVAVPRTLLIEAAVCRQRRDGEEYITSENNLGLTKSEFDHNAPYSKNHPSEHREFASIPNQKSSE